jgi:hypothetical protein
MRRRQSNPATTAPNRSFTLNPRTIALLALLCLPPPAQAQPTRVFLGDSAHPVASGEVWLVANRWGAYPTVLVARIREGELQNRSDIVFPLYWEQAFDYKVLLAVSSKPGQGSGSFEEDFAFTATPGSEGYLKPFSTVYLSDPLPPAHGGRDWESALEKMGSLTASDLVLPLAIRRTIRLLYPDGTPLSDASIPVALYGSSQNHCGVAVGVWLGTYTTDAAGELRLMATAAPLALARQYWSEEPGGPARTALAGRGDLEVGSDQEITVNKLWTIPEYDYVISLRFTGKPPSGPFRLNGCPFDGGCGSGCGPLPEVGPPDASGSFRFRAQDLRQEQSMSVVNGDGTERKLTDGEMRELLTTHHVDVAWP